MPFQIGSTYYTREDIAREREALRRADFSPRRTSRFRRAWDRIVRAWSLPPRPPARP